jgi:GNAT superfamily N-acetyltransferase
VRVREWDPATAPTAEIVAALDALNEIVSVDTPEDPRWRLPTFRDYLAETMPHERRIAWVAEENGTGRLLGYQTLLMIGNMGVLDIQVRPDARRGGAGTALLTAAVRRAHAAGYESIGVEVVGGTPGETFYLAHGFRCVYTEVRNVLDLSTVDWMRLGEMAHGISSGYRIEYHPGGPPLSMFEAYAATKARMREQPGHELDLHPSSYDAGRLKASITTLHARGLRPYVVVAVHEATETVAGLTEVVVPVHRPTRADQYDTIVVPIHRGYGLGRALKARMLFELRAAEPLVTDVQTWHGADNEAVVRVNAELGFKPDRRWYEFEADVADLVRHLGAS